jgi:hypothetical protein
MLCQLKCWIMGFLPKLPWGSIPGAFLLSRSGIGKLTMTRR